MKLKKHEMIIDEQVSNGMCGNKEELRNRIYERIEKCKEDLEFDFKPDQNKRNIPLAVMQTTIVNQTRR